MAKILSGVRNSVNWPNQAIVALNTVPGGRGIRRIGNGKQAIVLEPFS